MTLTTCITHLSCTIIYSSYPARVIIYDPYLGKVYHICTVSALCNAIYGYNLLITWHVDLCLLYLVIYKTVFFRDDCDVFALFEGWEVTG
jgi:hypothetical protein